MLLDQILSETLRGYDNVLNVSMFESPLGNILAAADDNYLYFVCFDDSKKMETLIHNLKDEFLFDFIYNEKNSILQQFKEELQLYFMGKLVKFTTPIKTFGSSFEKEVWMKLCEIPYATTKTYGTLAKEMGKRARYSRAVGNACGANMHLLIVPCHRLVAANSRGGFSCGIHRKEWLLQHEQKYAL